MCLSCNIKNSKTPAKVSENNWNKRRSTVTVSFSHSTRIRYQSSVMSTLLLLLFLSVTTWIRYQSSVMSTLILLLFLSVTLQESGTSHMWCQHLYSYCFFLSLQESGTSHLWCQHLYCYCFFLSLYKNQVPVICDVNTYTVTVSFCHSTRIRYQSSVMSTLIILLFLSVTLQESGTSLLWCHHLYCYCFFLSLYKNQVPVICDVITYNLTVSFCHSTVYQRSNSQVRHIPPKMSDKYPTNLRVNTL